MPAPETPAPLPEDLDKALDAFGMAEYEAGRRMAKGYRAASAANDDAVARLLEVRLAIQSALRSASAASIPASAEARQGEEVALACERAGFQQFCGMGCTCWGKPHEEWCSLPVVLDECLRAIRDYRAALSREGA
jgi:hypothetical protein